MFEDSLFASQPQVASVRGRWTAGASILVQGAVASLLVVVPLLHPETLPQRMEELRVLMPPPPAPPPPPRTVVQRSSSALTSTIPVLGRMFEAPRRTPTSIDTSPAPETAALGNFSTMGGPGLPGALSSPGDGAGSRISVTPSAPKKSGPVRVSAGVSAGLLLGPIRPVYPTIAKAAHVEGVVVVEAIISKAGTIESAHAVSGPAMLAPAALDAIRAARYAPFRLNGEPTEVQTTITVNFKMGG